MSRVKLTVATTDYDHFRDFRLGIVNAEGIEHTWLTLGHHEVFARFTFKSRVGRERAVLREVLRAGDARGRRHHRPPGRVLAALPLLVLLREQEQRIKTAADLKGKTIGSPEWAHTAAVYMRGWLKDEHGVALHDVHWYQAGAKRAGPALRRWSSACRKASGSPVSPTSP